MVRLSEKIGYALGDAAAGGITWKVMSIAFPLFFTNVFGLTVIATVMIGLVYIYPHYCPVKVDKSIFEIIEFQSFSSTFEGATI